ncbi:MAG TPA: hypothetical protein VLA76_00815 [Candidatus Angelobacter sp.]|nr:hypothetical protein [Candidatus Angelobacter sp.]
MSDAPTLVYLEADDEITALVRRVRAAPPGRVVVVAPGRSRATSSVVALRLLARTAESAGRAVVVVGDALTRSLAVDAGLPAFATVDEARGADLEDVPGAPPDEPRHAAIRVVRGPDADDTVAAATEATPAIPAPVTPPSGTESSGGPIGSFDETRPVPVARRAPEPRPRAAFRRRPSRGLGIALGVAAALLVAGVAVGATLLPAATVILRPIPTMVSATYELRVTELSTQPGEVEATATVTATGRYEELAPATGVVSFRNFNTGTVEVPAGALVAAGEQAFETTEAVVVPAGSLTTDGRIAAGEAEAPIVAAAAGPAANVEAEAIDTVLSQGVAARLRGFPQNTARLVINADPTSGGADASGPEVTQEDVDAAVAALEAELHRLADDEKLDPGSRILLEPPPAEPVIDLPDDLVGRRDEPEVAISGTLAWEQVVLDPEPLVEEAAARLAADPDVPADHDLLPEETEVTLFDPRLEGDEAVISADATGRAVPRVDADDIRTRIIGMSEPEAELALAGLGSVDVQLWPGWVTSVPDLDWRVDVRIEDASP